MPIDYRLIILALAVVAGWTARGYVEDSKDLATQKMQEAERKVFADRESAIAEKVETKLQELSANTKVIERERLKIIERPVYNTDCIDDDGVQLIKDIAKGEPTKPPS